jgi:hypothetical protein
MSAIDRGIHAQRPVDVLTGIGLTQQLGMNTVPGAIEATPVTALPRRLPRPEIDRQITPRDTGTEPPHDRLHHPTMILERAPALGRGHRHQRLDPSPLLISQNTIPRHT